MTHDPLCPCDQRYHYKCSGDDTCVCPCDLCTLIAKVRADQGAKFVAAVEAFHAPVDSETRPNCAGCAEIVGDEYTFSWPCETVRIVRALQGNPFPTR